MNALNNVAKQIYQMSEENSRAAKAERDSRAPLVRYLWLTSEEAGPD